MVNPSIGGSEFQLSVEQQRIVRARGNQVVLAGAGTGKTETLTQRVLHLLSDADVDSCALHEIVVLTFTDKAAGEMRQRVYQGILRRLRQEMDPAQRERLNYLRVNFAAQNRIGTFDSFNYRLLSQFPELDLTPLDFTPMSSYEERYLKEQITRSFWQHAGSLDADENAALFELLDSYERRQLIDLISIMAQEEQGRLEELARMPDESTFKTELAVLVTIAAERIHRRHSRKLEALWSCYETAIPGKLPPDLDRALRDPARLSFRGSDVVTQKNCFAKRFVAPHWTQRCAELESSLLPLLAPWRKLENRLRDLSTALQTGGDEAEEAFAADWQSRGIVQRLAVFALWWREQRRELCRRHGWIDFAEMQRQALHLLESNPEVTDRLRQGCRYILIDEFQDTNMSQWKLIDAFRRPDNVLIVGDGKQAIYQFRGGDITVFDEVQQLLIAGEAPNILTISRRSTPAIVGFCNLLFRTLLPAPGSEREPYEAEFQELQSGRDADGCSGVWTITAGVGTPFDSDYDRYFDDEMDETSDAEIQEPTTGAVPQAEAVAQLLAELQADADEGVATRRPEWAEISAMMRAEEPGTIGMLFTTHARKALFEEALRARSVRFTSVKGVGFFQSEQVRDATNLANFLFDTEDSLALAAVLRSPLVGANDRALLELRIADVEKPLWQVLCDLISMSDSQPKQSLFDENPLDAAVSDENDRRALSLGYERLRCWRELARVTPFSAVLETVWRESDLAFYNALHFDAPQRTENWRKLIEIVREREERGWGNLRDITEFLTAQGEEEEKEADAALPEGGSVQLMTIYAAKGLGFPMTIVAQMDSPPRLSPTSMRRGEFPNRETVHYCVKPVGSDGERKDTLLWTILREEERARREAEYRRLLYVACTRARDHLVLVLPGETKHNTWAEMVAPLVAELPTVERAT